VISKCEPVRPTSAVSATDRFRYRPREYDPEDGPWDPISGGASALLGTMASMMMGFAETPVDISRALRSRHEESTGPATPNNMKNGNSSVSSGAAPTDRITTQATCGHLSCPGVQGTEPSLFHPSHLLGRTDIDCQLANRISLDAALGGGKGVGRILKAGLKLPMDFTLSVARGFHNAPKLYGDETVRNSKKVAGFKSGLKAAGKVRISLLSATFSPPFSLTRSGAWFRRLRWHLGTCDSAHQRHKEGRSRGPLEGCWQRRRRDHH